MAYNNQQAPFWDFIRGYEQNGAGVDHPAEHPAQGFNPFGPPPHGPPPHPFGAGFPFGGPQWGQGPEHHGRGGFGGRGGRRGRHGRRRDEDRSHTPNGSRSPSPHGEHTEGEAGEGSHSPRHGRHGSHGPHGRHGSRGPHGPHGPHEARGPHGHGPGRHGRGGWGAWARGGGEGFGGHGGRHGHRGGPPPPGGFDLNALMESLSAHPLAQAFRNYTEGQRSGETLVPEDSDAENTFIPPVDVFSTEKAYVLHVALPGAKKEDVGVNWDAEKGILNLAGVVYRQGDEEFLKTLSKSERKVGVFERTIKLPPGTEEKEEIEGDSITAKLEDGVLVVTVPKVEKEERWTEIKKVDIV